MLECDPYNYVSPDRQQLSGRQLLENRTDPFGFIVGFIGPDSRLLKFENAVRGELNGQLSQGGYRDDRSVEGRKHE